MATLETGQQKVFGFVIPAGADGESVKQSMIAAMTVVGLLLVFLFLVFPRFSDLVAADNRVKQLEESVTDFRASLEALDVFARKVTPVAKESVYLAIPVKFDPGYILLSLRKLAQENRVNLITYKLSSGAIEEKVEKATSKGLTPHSIKVEISGPPVNLIDFVENLDQYLPVASVSDLSISEVSKIIKSSLSESKLTMTMTFYHMSLAKEEFKPLSGNVLVDKDFESINSLSLYKRLEAAGVGNIPMGGGNENLFGL